MLQLRNATFPLFWDGSSLAAPSNSNLKSLYTLENSSCESLLSDSIETNYSLTLAPLNLDSKNYPPTKLPSISEILCEKEPKNRDPVSQIPHKGKNSPILLKRFNSWSSNLAFPSLYPSRSKFNDGHEHSSPKRIRRKFHEVERKFNCLYPECHKSYGALNHLNAHISSQGHGRRRKAKEFRQELTGYSLY